MTTFDSTNHHTNQQNAVTPAIVREGYAQPSPLGMLNQTNLDNKSDEGHSFASAVASSASVPATAAEKAKQIFRPVVFQCRQCRTIVADSSDLSSTDPVNRQITFRRDSHPNIAISADWQLQQAGFAFGSVYQNLACRNCSCPLGVRFNTTSADVDHLRGMLTLKAEKLVMYELQFDDARMKKDIEEAFGGPLVPTNGAGAKADDVEVTKLQKFCLVLYDRIVRLEEQVITLTAKKDQ